MNATKTHKLLATLLVGFLVAHAQNKASAQILQEPLTLSATYNSTLTVNGASWTPINVSFKGHVFLVGSYDDTLTLSFTPTAELSGNVLSLSTPGYVDLNLASCDTADKIQFQPNGSGSISMDPSVKLGLTIAVSFIGTGSGSFPNFNDTASATIFASPLSFPASGSINCFGITPNTVTLTSQQFPTLYSEDLLEDFLDVPDWLVAVDLNVDACITLQQTVKATGLSCDFGNANSYCGQQLWAGLNSCSDLSVNNIVADWSDSISVQEGLGVGPEVTILWFVIWDPPPLFCTPSLLEQTRTISLSSGSPQSVTFTFPSYTEQVIQTAGGNVTPAGPVTLCEGQCQTFTATPDSGDGVCGWVTNFVEATIGTPPKLRPYIGRTFPLSGVQNDGTIEAIFCPVFNPWNPANINTAAAEIIAPCCIWSLNGTVNPSGYGGSAWYQYGVTDAYDITDPVDLGLGSTNIFVSNVLTGLLPNTTYSFELVTSNSNGYFDGGVQTFTTAAVGPTVSTGAVIVVDGATVLLNGNVNPNGSPATAGFFWGVDTNYGNASPTPPISLGPDTAPNGVTGLLTNLLPGTTYHYQLWATNDVGTAFTPDQVFTTPGVGPIITNVQIVSLTATNAYLNAIVNPNGQDTTVWVNWGITTNFGIATPSQDLGSANTNLGVAVTLGPLNPTAIYYAELVATNANGTTVSQVMVFGNVTTTAVSSFQITSLARQGNNVLIAWQALGDATNVVQVSPGTANGSYSSNNFINLSSPIFVPGSGLIATNYLDVGGATNKPARYYRIRVSGP